MSAATLRRTAGAGSRTATGSAILARSGESENVAIHLAIRSHAGDESVRDGRVEADFVERVDVLLERFHAQRLDVVADLAEGETAAVDIELVAEEVTARADHAEQLGHHAVMRPHEGVVHAVGILLHQPLDARDRSEEHTS